jgi:hypothetical protein
VNQSVLYLISYVSTPGSYFPSLVIDIFLLHAAGTSPAHILCADRFWCLLVSIDKKITN